MITDRLPDSGRIVGLFFADGSWTPASRSELGWHVDAREGPGLGRKEKPIGWLSMHDTIEEAKRRRAEHERRAA
jgi:hypothetical protein